MNVNANSIQKINGVNYFIDAIKNHYFDFNGRASRSAYWYFALFSVLGYVVLNVIDELLLVPIIGFPILCVIFSLALLLPNLGGFPR